MDYLVSNFDLEKILGKKCWVQYKALNNMTKIEQLLPKQKDFKIILIHESYNSGKWASELDFSHWVCITRNENKYEFFNSYGQDIRKTMSYVENPKMQNENPNKLIELLKGQKYEYNKVDFQGQKASDCGRWCLLFVLLFKYYDSDISYFQEFMKNIKQKTGLSFDKIVVKLTEKIIGN